MIRPITVICWILALGSGLYLYRAKHEVELMDKHIEQIAKATGDIRAESRRLLDDWIRLGEPVQLQKYSDQYLGLKAISPTQFVRLIDLPNRLPPPRADPPATPVDAEAEMTVQTSPPAETQPTTTAASDADEVEAGDLPVPPIPPTDPPLTSVTLQAVTAPPLQARPVTPRPVAGAQDLSTARPHPPTETRVADEPSEAAGKPAPTIGIDPRQAIPGLPGGSPPRQASAPPRDTSPSQTPTQGLPPLQAQGPARQAERTLAENRVNDVQRDGAARGQVPPSLQAQGQVRPVERTVADGRTNDARRDVRSTQAAAPPRPLGLSVPPAGSLLGMSRAPVPLPIPAPTPVNAVWTGPGSGPGR